MSISIYIYLYRNLSIYKFKNLTEFVAVKVKPYYCTGQLCSMGASTVTLNRQLVDIHKS